MAPLLEVSGMSVRYGGVRALTDASLQVPANSIVGLIGPNGAGKTTMVDAITGFARCTGRVELDGTVLSGMPAHRRVRHGLARTFQSLELFEDLSIRENLLVSTSPGRWWSVFPDLVAPTRKLDVTAVDEALDLVGLTGQAELMPPSLPHGRRKLIGVARAMATRPRVLLLDEPAAGLDSGESLAFGAEMRRLVEKQGLGILLVDHDMGLVLSVCDYIYVLQFGQLISQGTPAQIREDPAVIAAYLGEQKADQKQEAAPVPDTPAVTAPRPRTAAADPVLSVKNLTTGYNGVPVVRDLSLTIGRGEVVALFGPNGAGKTTTLLTISGLVRPMSGSIRLDDAECVGVTPHGIARRGLGHVPEDRAIVPSLTVRENLRLVRSGPSGAAQRQALEYFPALGPLLDRRAAMLSGGEQQMLALGRALASRPKLLMIDEMSLGLAPVIVQQLLPVMRRIADETGTGILLVEQHVHLALDVCDNAYVLSHGDLVLEGSSAELSANRELLESSYLGLRADSTPSV